jgi:hypothetical protein
MPGTTPNYGWPYQLLTDPPNGASLGHDGLIAADATMAAEASARSTADAAEATNRALIKRTKMYARPTQSGFGTLGAGSTATVASFTIPDPGYPFHIVSCAMVDFGAATAGQALLLSINVDSTVINTNAITQGAGVNVLAGVGFDVNADAPIGNSLALSGSGYTGGTHVLSFVAKNSSSGTMTLYNGPSGNGGVPYQYFIMTVEV